MTLSEIETTVQELAARHNNLTIELLTTLLLSAGWEDKNIKEAVMLFKQNSASLPITKVVTPTNVVPVSVDAISEIKKTNEEADLVVLHDVEENKTTVVSQQTIPVTTEVLSSVKESTEKENIQEVKVPDLIQNIEPAVDVVEEVKPVPVEMVQSEPIVKNVEVVTPVPPEKEILTIPDNNKEEIPIVSAIHEEQSLVIHDEPVKEKIVQRPVELPENLPLLPFESSPHVWSFSKYKDVFHSDEIHPLPFEIAGHNLPEVHHSTNLFHAEYPPVIKEETTTPSVLVSTVVPMVQPDPVRVIVDKAPPILVTETDEEVVFEKIPLTKGDESLVFLAGVMLLVIILILGYMYSNGRL